MHQRFRQRRQRNGRQLDLNAYSTQYNTGWKIMPCVTDRFFNSTWTVDVTDDVPAATHGSTPTTAAA